jgi:BirA family biotin operon repressor/biotin-[acetyl-CoA-carboxylase] ligase
VTAGLPCALPEALRARVGWLPLMAAVSAAEMLRARWDVRALIRWPNDLLVEGRKLAGFLGQVLQPPRSASAVPAESVALIGMGLNWANRVEPEALTGGYAAVSLCDLRPELTQDGIADFLTGWLARLGQRYLNLLLDPAAAFAALRQEAEAILWAKGETVGLELTEHKDRARDGLLEGLGENAGACVLLADGRAVQAHCGSLQYGSVKRAARAGENMKAR